MPVSLGMLRPLGREAEAAAPQVWNREVLATLNADYPWGCWLQRLGNPPPEAPDCLSISLQNVYFIYFFPHECLIRYLDEAHSSRLQRAAGGGVSRAGCHALCPLPHCPQPVPAGSPRPTAPSPQCPAAWLAAGSLCGRRDPGHPNTAVIGIPVSPNLRPVGPGLPGSARRQRAF